MWPVSIALLPRVSPIAPRGAKEEETKDPEDEDLRGSSLQIYFNTWYSIDSWAFASLCIGCSGATLQYEARGGGQRRVPQKGVRAVVIPPLEQILRLDLTTQMMYWVGFKIQMKALVQMGYNQVYAHYSTLQATMPLIEQYYNLQLAA